MTTEIRYCPVTRNECALDCRDVCWLEKTKERLNPETKQRYTNFEALELYYKMIQKIKSFIDKNKPEN